MVLPTPKKKPSLARLSSDASMLNLVVLIYGQFGVGKSTMALTASSKFPKAGLPTVRSKGTPKLILDDLLWISFDKGATLGFKERGIAVLELDVRELMGDKEKWKAAGFSTAPSVLLATEKILQETESIVAEGKVKWIVVDTISTYDKMLDVYWDKHVPTSLAGKEITIQKYGKILSSHRMLHDNLMLMNCGVIYLCHLKTNIDLDKDSAEKNAKVRKAISMPGSPTIVPDITGKGAGSYKADNRLQLLLRGVRAPGSKGLTRSVSTVQTSDGEEAKNSFQLSLNETEGPDLGAILAKIIA